MNENNYPKLHNATWPGIVGKGPDSEPPISFDSMLEMTAAAEVDGVKFDGVDVGLLEPHVDINNMDEIKRLADKVSSFNLNIGTLVAPIWGGPAMGSKEERAQFIEQVRKSCIFGSKLREMGVRPHGVIRIDSASTPENWAVDPVNNTKLIAQTFREACDVAADYGEKLAAEGEICWGGMHSWKTMIDTLEAVDRPNIGFQADMSHTLLYLLGYNRPEDRILPKNFEWSDREALTEGLRTLTNALRPWTIDFHVAQNDGTVHGTGSHDKTGRHCQALDPNGKLDIAKDAGHWLRDKKGELTKAFKHICWDGCMFSNDVMQQQQTWNDILATMIKVRQLHGWYEPEKKPVVETVR
ncbi:sugar phosphate isomerase/epimerase [Pontibacter diazotrophicus]|uniref:Sugar phosphate isomerase/epimerase n=1 Tax=Pontibacter diazotrophicus TaxID=1400979 RepID=A0A3D8L7X3_9BACT|nr:TIM barrel protein [Pontibacter diazotrophicus]RDV13498.1 sugar phosphate isomerase/epimerase [Pontibacter diazotrophicus]